ncbi:MAG: phosphate ABC transporter permease PstA [Deltaproteobacteria bacterium]|jgi:phosphate transport system permease protein|nr:phosphate ABC transporter permease PstA [Deltaproteobacteria bacterium]
MNASPFATSARTATNRRVESVGKTVLAGVTALLILPLTAILGLLVIRGAPALSMEFLLEAPTAGMTAGGVFPAIVGTLWLVGVSLAVSAPVGIMAGIYLNEYAKANWLTRMVNLAIVNLAGVPSIVHALFGVGVFVLFLGLGTSILSASLTLAIMTLPVIIASTKEALAAVPMAFREACWTLGATRWQTIRHVVLPNSISGILTGVILQVSRAAGETAPIMFTGAAFYLPFLPQSVQDQCMALSMHLFTVSTQVPNVPEAIPYATALVLLSVVLLVNLFAIAFRTYLRRNRKW